MAINAINAAHILKTSQESGAALMLAHCCWFDNNVNWLKNQMPRTGDNIRTKGYGVHTNWGPAGWFTQKQLTGEGAPADMGIHSLDTARFLFGNRRPFRVYARIGTTDDDLT